MSNKISHDYIYYLIIIAIIALVGWMIYAVYGTPVSLEKSQSPGMCNNGLDCAKQNASIFSKDNLTDAQKKLSTDLVRAIENENKTKNQVVYVYITTFERADPAIITPYVWNITDADPANHLIVAWMNVDNLTLLASLDSVQSIRTVTPPRNADENAWSVNES
jgi:hypothetical protein